MRRAKGYVEEAGAIASLAARTLVAAIRAPYPYGRELVHQFGLALRLSALPLLFAAFSTSFGLLGVQLGGLQDLMGSPDRVGALVGLFGSRQVGPVASGVVVAGAAGAAICADLGSRATRHELDALDVLGVDLVKSLVVPRLLALVILTPLLSAAAVQLCAAGGLLAARPFGVSPSVFAYMLFNSATGPFGVFGMVLKGAIFGAIVAVVACFKGMTASGGPEGVGRAVSQAVVVSLMGILAANYVISYLLLALTPELNVVR